MKQLGIFGGTFNPIHLGHVDTVSQVIRAAQLEQVRYIPASVPPHRAAPGVSAEHRLEMVRIATAQNPLMVADDIELNRDGPSYTVDTVESLANAFPGCTLHLILGLDALLGIESWHRWETLLNQVNVVVMVRPGWPLPVKLPEWWSERKTDITQLEPSETGKIMLVPIMPVDISSTSVREALRQGNPVQQWLHPGVWQYIQDHNLYE
ncbi:MAG: nicotinate-nucleotide adenylyltransferase [Acidiferrobacterales bacterium]|nr:nicotinate-nucleotide adenylyltransferase [Acidiferrobacterales bacterium]